MVPMGPRRNASPYRPASVAAPRIEAYARREGAPIGADGAAVGRTGATREAAPLKGRRGEAHGAVFAGLVGRALPAGLAVGDHCGAHSARRSGWRNASAGRAASKRFVTGSAGRSEGDRLARVRCGITHQARRAHRDAAGRDVAASLPCASDGDALAERAGEPRHAVGRYVVARASVRRGRRAALCGGVATQTALAADRAWGVHPAARDCRRGFDACPALPDVDLAEGAQRARRRHHVARRSALRNRRTARSSLRDPFSARAARDERGRFGEVDEAKRRRPFGRRALWADTVAARTLERRAAGGARNQHPRRRGAGGIVHRIARGRGRSQARRTLRRHRRRCRDDARSAEPPLARRYDSVASGGPAKRAGIAVAVRDERVRELTAGLVDARRRQRRRRRTCGAAGDENETDDGEPRLPWTMADCPHPRRLPRDGASCSAARSARLIDTVLGLDIVSVHIIS